MHLVPLSERAQLLQMRTGTLGVDVGDWVRIRQGTYRQDLGYVLSVDNLISRVRLLLVPRLTYKSGRVKQAGKRPKSQRQPPALLDINLARTFEGGQRLNGPRFQGKTFMDRLLVKEYAQCHLITVNVRPTYEEIRLFRTSTAVDRTAIRKWEIGDAIRALRIDDRIEVLVGELKGCCGVILDIHDSIAQVEVQQEGNTVLRDKHTLDIPLLDVRKAFREGDFVGIRHGVNAGVTGYVLSVSDDSSTVTLYRYEADPCLDMTSQVRMFIQYAIVNNY